MYGLMAALLTTLGSVVCPHYELVPKEFDANLRFRERLLADCRNDEELAVSVRQMCSEDLLFYVNAFCWTYDPRDPEMPMLPFITYEEFQDEAFLEVADAVMNGRDVAVPKSRCMGASWIGLTVFEWFWHFRPHMSFLLISRNEKYVDEKGNPKSLFWKIDCLHKYQPKWLLPTGRHLGQRDPGRKLLHLENIDNGSVIDGESTTGDAGRGDRRTAMFIDEHAAFDPNDGFRVLRATRDTTKCRIFNSTPQGSNNAFYEVVHNTAAKILRMHWTSHPVYNKGLYTSDADGNLQMLDDFRGIVEVRVKGEKDPKKYQYPDEYPFRKDGKLRSPWYDNECARCVSEMEIAQELDIDFLGSDYQFFDTTTIDKLIKQYCRMPEYVGDLAYDRITFDPIGFNEEPQGKLYLWLVLDGEFRVPGDRRFVIGSDVSAGTGASNSVSSVVDIASGEKVGVFRTPHLRPTEFAKVTMALAKWFNNAFMIWDASGPTGKVFTQAVIETNYGNIYYRRAKERVMKKVSDQPGVFLNPEERSTLLERYRESLGSHSFINRSKRGMEECKQFIVQPGGLVVHSKAANSQDPTGAKSAHGDEVIADALADRCVSEKATMVSNKEHEQEAPVGSLAWRRKQAELEKNKTAGSRELDESWI